MHIPRQEIEDLRRMLREDGHDMSYEEAESIGYGLVNYVRAVLCGGCGGVPVPTHHVPPECPSVSLKDAVSAGAVSLLPSDWRLNA